MFITNVDIFKYSLLSPAFLTLYKWNHKVFSVLYLVLELCLSVLRMSLCLIFPRCGIVCDTPWMLSSPHSVDTALPSFCPGSLGMPMSDAMK